LYIALVGVVAQESAGDSKNTFGDKVIAAALSNLALGDK